jgi:CheY-like chemotaxis protein
MLVDDHARGAAAVATLLERAGAAVTDVATGDEALGLLHGAAAAGEPYDVVLLDDRMPDRDGIAVAGAVLATPSLRSARVVVLASSVADHRAAFADAGISHFVTKPPRRANLVRVVAGAEGELATPRGERPAPPVAAAPDPAGRRVLVAEDNPVNQLVIEAMLAKVGMTADIVPTGRHAVEQLDPGIHVAILMDCHMPEVDGYEATRRIRDGERDGARVPIIAMTANAMSGDRERCLEAGMDDYLAKPLRSDELSAALERAVPGALENPA